MMKFPDGGTSRIISEIRGQSARFVVCAQYSSTPVKSEARSDVAIHVAFLLPHHLTSSTT
jgi:hypothetical protein